MKKLIIAVLVLAVVLVCTVMIASAGARVRARIVAYKVLGRLPGVTRADLAPIIRPGAGFDLDALEATRNPYASLRTPPHLAGDTARGRSLFESRCSQCHGRSAEGISGPGLAAATRKHGTTDWAAFRVIQDGVPGSAMVPTGLGFDDTWRVIAHITRTVAARADSSRAGRPPLPPITDADIAGADQSLDEWRLYNGGWSGHRNKDVPALTATTVGTMRMGWAYQMPRDPPTSQSTPIAVRGLLIVTAATDVIALDQVSGAVVWQWHRDLPEPVKLCCSRANRGVGVFGDLVFVGTLDAHLFALDLATGQVRWTVHVAEASQGYSITGAPFPVEGKLIVGVGGGEFGIRGFLDCYEPATGKRLWRTWTVPAKGEPGSETWNGTTPGGGPTWVPGAYDPATKTLYWGVGNPSPDFAPDVRPGDNLFTNSAIAVDLETGTIKWSFQFTPNDSHDWDSAQTPILADITWEGQRRPVVLWANRNGYFYVLDRATGKFLRATQFGKQTWNDGFDANGHAKPRADAAPTPNGTVVYPGVGGATNWWPSAYSDKLGMVFISAKDDGSVFFRDRTLTNEADAFLGGRTQPVAGQPPVYYVIAMDAETGSERWKSIAPETRSSAMGGLLAIGDRLVIGGQSNTFFALDARTGKRVWEASLGGPIYGAPVTFRTNGKTRVAVVAGTVLFVFELPA